jgi:hypothetical protein
MQPIEKYFAQLCEGVLFEYSTSMQILRKLPGGEEIVSYLHKQYDLSHDQEYREVPKISWSELKNNKSWVLLQYRNGVGAIKQSGGRYYALAATSTGEVQSFDNDRGGNIMEFLKERLGGNPRKIFVGSDTGKLSRKKRERAERSKGASKETRIDKDILLKKFKPLWIRAMNAAIADVKGMVSVMIKNDSFEKAAKKVEHLKNLSNNVEQFETNPDSLTYYLSKHIQKSILQAASYHYPDETGEITKGYGGNYDSQNSQGPQKILADISAGDTAKMGTVLSFFKKSLITG